MTATPSADRVDAFLDRALEGESREAIDFALQLLDSGIPQELVISDLLAPAQREVGDRWQRNELSVADEHLATGVAESALCALGAATTRGATGMVVVACAEGDWHAIAAHMLAEQLRGRGVAVAFLGGSTPTEHVARLIERQHADAIAVSCNLPLFYAGVARLADAAHALGVPLLAGGRALLGGPERARLLGADGWADNIDDAIALLTGWKTEPPAIAQEPISLDADAVELDGRAVELAAVAFTDLTTRFPAMATYDPRQLARTREDLVFIARFVGAAQLVDDDAVLTEFLDWLTELLDARGVPKAAVTAGLESLHPLVGSVSATARGLVDLGLEHLDAIGTG